MAHAEKTSIEVTTTVEGVVLELTPEEAQFVTDVMAKVSGSPDVSRRKHADAIYAAMHAAGYTSSMDTRPYGSAYDLTGVIQCRDMY